MSEINWEMTPRDIKHKLDSGEALRLIDVREPLEHQIARIEGADLVPMRSIPSVLSELEVEERPIVVFCHHGMRSLQVVAWLRDQGITGCTSMAGGIDRWSLEIDGSVPRY